MLRELPNFSRTGGPFFAIGHFIWDPVFRSTIASSAIASSIVFEEGNVLHALCKFDPCSRFRRPGRRYSVHELLPFARNSYCHVSKDKFMAAIYRGADIHARGLHGTVRQAAECFVATGEKSLSKTDVHLMKGTSLTVKEATSYIDSAPTFDATIRD